LHFSLQLKFIEDNANSLTSEHFADTPASFWPAKDNKKLYVHFSMRWHFWWGITCRGNCFFM